MLIDLLESSKAIGLCPMGINIIATQILVILYKLSFIVLKHISHV